MRGRAMRRFHVTGLVLLAVSPALAQSTAVTVGDGWAVVREERTLAFSNVEQAVTLDDVAAEADLSSLVFWSEREPIQLLSWSREMLVHDSDEPGDEETRTWTPGGKKSDKGVPVIGPLSCRLLAESTGSRTVQMAYLMTGLTWRVSYNVLVRGDPSNEQERISVDLDGNLMVMNATSKTFSNALLRIVGSDTAAEAEQAEPGILMMDDSPLADLWLKKKAPTPVSFLYNVPSRAFLRAHAETEMSLVASARKPADRLYRLITADYPLNEREQTKPLHRVISLENAPSYGVGQALPAGPARIFRGSYRATLAQQAWFAHTPASATFRIDLGPTESVLGSRRSLGRSPVVAGAYEEQFSVLLENRLSSPADIEIEDEPATSLQWEIVRASAPYVVSGRRIVFSVEASPKSQVDVRYTLRVREPTY